MNIEKPVLPLNAGPVQVAPMPEATRMPPPCLAAMRWEA
jgi:hypothetical protein